MNKILIVGHPASGCQQVEALLHQCGMGAAQPSRREGLQPQDVTATLCKAHNVPPADTVLVEEDFQQIDAGAVWHGMALDLMLGNLDQALWGWVDSQAIYTLDYWKTLDPKLTFVLVYDEPQRVLMEAAASGQPLAGPAVQQILDNWTAYNGALLRFFLRNSGRCLLVHSQQVRRAVDAYLQQLQPLIDAPLTLDAVQSPAAEQAQEEVSDDGTSDAAGDALAIQPCADASFELPSGLAKAIATMGVEPREAASLMDIGAAERYLAGGVLANHPAAQQLYAELQSAANLPLDRPEAPQSQPAMAWSALVRQRAFMSDLVVQIHAQYQSSEGELAQRAVDNELLLGQLHALQGEVERHSIESECKIQRLTVEAKAAGEKVEISLAENDRLLGQLHEVQEELERQLLRKQELERHSTNLEHEIQRLAAEAKAAEQQARSTTAVKLKELADENELLLNQLHQVQEELERYYLDNQRLKQRLSPPQPPAPYGAAERIKRQLSYRLGATMIQRSRSIRGWAGMPWALIAETRAFRKERAGQPGKLPPIHTYCDARDAERIRNHLSYRLGSTLIANGKSPIGWMKLPFALHREVKIFRQSRVQKQAHK